MLTWAKKQPKYLVSLFFLSSSKIGGRIQAKRLRTIECYWAYPYDNQYICQILLVIISLKSIPYVWHFNFMAHLACLHMRPHHVCNLFFAVVKFKFSSRSRIPFYYHHVFVQCLESCDDFSINTDFYTDVTKSTCSHSHTNQKKYTRKLHKNAISSCSALNDLCMFVCYRTKEMAHTVPAITTIIFFFYFLVIFLCCANCFSLFF